MFRRKTFFANVYCIFAAYRICWKNAVIDISVYIDHPDDADVGSSRDCLLSTSNHSSRGWTFNGMMWEAASTLWRRMTSGNTTLYKSKSE
jgi:hypothetical protein